MDYRIQAKVNGIWIWGLWDYTKAEAVTRQAEMAKTGITCRVRNFTQEMLSA